MFCFCICLVFSAWQDVSVWLQLFLQTRHLRRRRLWGRARAYPSVNERPARNVILEWKDSFWLYNFEVVFLVEYVMNANWVFVFPFYVYDVEFNLQYIMLRYTNLIVFSEKYCVVNNSNISFILIMIDNIVLRSILIGML